MPSFLLEPVDTTPVANKPEALWISLTLATLSWFSRGLLVFIELWPESLLDSSNLVLFATIPELFLLLDPADVTEDIPSFLPVTNKQEF